MGADSLKIHENEDGSFSMEWDREDQNWNWLNDLTSAEIETMLQEAIKNYGGTQRKTDLEYKNYSLEKLSEWIRDSFILKQLLEIYDTITTTLKQRLIS